VRSLFVSYEVYLTRRSFLGGEREGGDCVIINFVEAIAFYLN
jgi:hypothetical protein